MNECVSSAGTTDVGCERTRALLSAHVDRELVISADAAIETHLLGCEACRRIRDDYLRLGTLVARPDDERNASEAERRWRQLETALSSDPPRPAWWRSAIERRGPALVSLAAIAALLLVPLSLSVLRIGSVDRSARNDEAVADLFDDYLERFGRSPEAAQAFIDTAYPTDRVPVDSRDPHLTESILFAHRTLPGLELVDFRYHHLPCCDCLQGSYRRRDGSLVTVFEHVSRSEWDAHQVDRVVRCGECECRLSRPTGPIAASWEHHAHTFTAVGITDEKELEMLVSRL